MMRPSFIRSRARGIPARSSHQPGSARHPRRSTCGGSISGRRRRMPATRSAAVIVAGVLAPHGGWSRRSRWPRQPEPAAGSRDRRWRDRRLVARRRLLREHDRCRRARTPVRAKLYLRYDCDRKSCTRSSSCRATSRHARTRPDEAYIRIDGRQAHERPSTATTARAGLRLGERRRHAGRRWEGSGLARARQLHGPRPRPHRRRQRRWLHADGHHRAQRCRSSSSARSRSRRRPRPRRRRPTPTTPDGGVRPTRAPTRRPTVASLPTDRTARGRRCRRPTRCPATAAEPARMALRLALFLLAGAIGASALLTPPVAGSRSRSRSRTTPRRGDRTSAWTSVARHSMTTSDVRYAGICSVPAFACP